MLSETLRDAGVVGAVGAGFPTYVKAQSQVEYMIANGAECEPLIHKDAELMKHFPAEILAGMTTMMDATGARTGKFGVKTKNAGAASIPATADRIAAKPQPIESIHGTRTPSSRLAAGSTADARSARPSVVYLKRSQSGETQTSTTSSS